MASYSFSASSSHSFTSHSSSSSSSSSSSVTTGAILDQVRLSSIHQSPPPPPSYTRCSWPPWGLTSQGCGGSSTTQSVSPWQGSTGPGTGSLGPPRQAPPISPTWPGPTSATRCPASTASLSMQNRVLYNIVQLFLPVGLSQSENFEPRDCWVSGRNNQVRGSVIQTSTHIMQSSEQR